MIQRIPKILKIILGIMKESLEYLEFLLRRCRLWGIQHILIGSHWRHLEMLPLLIGSRWRHGWWRGQWAFGSANRIPWVRTGEFFIGWLWCHYYFRGTDVKRTITIFVHEISRIKISTFNTIMKQKNTDYDKKSWSNQMSQFEKWYSNKRKVITRKWRKVV